MEGLLLYSNVCAVNYVIKILSLYKLYYTGGTISLCSTHAQEIWCCPDYM